MIAKPDYTGKSIVNLCSSILSACGVSSPYNPLESDTLDSLPEYDNIVLLIIDGLGYDYHSFSEVNKDEYDISFPTIYRFCNHIILHRSRTATTYLHRVVRLP